jgi:hypothetical protein
MDLPPAVTDRPWEGWPTRQVTERPWEVPLWARNPFDGLKRFWPRDGSPAWWDWGVALGEAATLHLMDRHDQCLERLDRAAEIARAGGKTDLRALVIELREAVAAGTLPPSASEVLAAQGLTKPRVRGGGHG